jgi:hypothetical protein
MTQTYSEPGTAPATRAPAPVAPPILRFRFVALAVVVLVTVLVGVLILRDKGNSGSTNSGTSTPQSLQLAAQAVTVAQLSDLAKSIGHPVFWIGPSAGRTYELSRGSNGSIFVRYLPAGVPVGSSQAYLTVATYPFAGAYTALEKVATEKGATRTRIADGGLAVVSTHYPDSVHIAYPALDYQVEVYDPTPGAALALVRHGTLAAFGNLAAGSSGAQAVSAAALRAFANSLDHPVYWVGPRKHSTYELTQTQSGQVYIRYLPPGVAAGASQPYLTVATYRFPGAFGAIQALAKQPHMTSFKLAGGGLAVLDERTPTSIHLAFPGSDYQVEVFDTDARVVRNLISSGRVSRIG